MNVDPIEQRHDEHGIAGWPAEITPYDVHAVVLPGLSADVEVISGKFAVRTWSMSIVVVLSLQSRVLSPRPKRLGTEDSTTFRFYRSRGLGPWFTRRAWRYGSFGVVII